MPSLSGLSTIDSNKCADSEATAENSRRSRLRLFLSDASITPGTRARQDVGSVCRAFFVFQDARRQSSSENPTPSTLTLRRIDHGFSLPHRPIVRDERDRAHGAVVENSRREWATKHRTGIQ